MATGGSILVGVDESPGSRQATEWAATQARLARAEVIAVHVLTVDEEFLRDLPPAGLTTWRGRVRGLLEGPWTAPLAEVRHRSLLVEDESVADGLARAADDHDVELIVLGAHGRPNLRDRLLGASTYRLTQRTHRPVVIVPADWRESS